MERKLIKFNDAAYNNSLQYARKDLKNYNILLREINPICSGLGITVSLTVISALLKNPKEYAFDAIMENKPLTISGAPISKSKAMDLIEMPECWLKIIAIVSAFNAESIKSPFHKAQGYNGNDTQHIGLESFELANDELVLSDDFMEQLKELCSEFTVNELENTALKHINTLKRTFVELDKIGALPLRSTLTLEDIGYSQYGGIGEPLVVNLDPEIMMNKVRAYHRENNS